MALKDWERNGKYDWIKRIKGKRLIEKHIVIDENYGGQPIIDIEYFRDKKKDKRVVFKTKSKALAYAKAYMKTH